MKENKLKNTFIEIPNEELKVTKKEIKIHLEAARLREKFHKLLELEDIIRYKDTEILRKKDFKRINLYKILKLNSKRGLDSSEFRKFLHKNYLIELKRYHPDVYKGSKNLCDSIYYAFNILNDPYWRKKYDDYFIDEEMMPWSEVFIYKGEMENMNYETFFIIFSQILFEYERHSKGGKKSPSIGHINSPVKDIQKFYHFWDNFESNRNFDVSVFYYGIETLDDYQFDELMRENETNRRYLFQEHMKNLKEIIKLMKESDPRLVKSKNQNSFADENFSKEDLKNLQKLVKQFTKGKKVSWPFVASKLNLKNGNKVSLPVIQKKYEEIKNRKL